MNFELSEDQRTFQTLAKNFSDNELKPNAAKWDAECIFPIETIKKASKFDKRPQKPKKYRKSKTLIFFPSAAEPRDFADAAPQPRQRMWPPPRTKIWRRHLYRDAVKFYIGHSGAQFDVAKNR